MYPIFYVSLLDPYYNKSGEDPTSRLEMALLNKDKE
jgi:hypothetical protein